MAVSHPSRLGDAPHGDATVADEVLSVTERTRVLRRHPHSSASVIVKQGLGADSIRRLRHEAAVLQRLARVVGVSKLIDDSSAPDALVLQDHGGITLAQRLLHARPDTASVLRMGLQLTRIVAAVHQQGVVHQDINPSNVLLVGEACEPVLIDFNIARCAALAAPAFSAQSDIAGTLAYLSPEQTGRTGRSVDQRADLYALGTTLYEMATGRTPFQGDDPLALIHDHLVRVPVPPIARVPELPQQLSDIVMRLLEKEPERRYQSAEGLAHDLVRVIESLASPGHAPFELGEYDFAARLAAPARLMGREAEVAALRRTLERSLGGDTRALLVAGAAGVGKTALVNELRPLVSAQRGWFVAGKFDPNRRDLTTSAVVLAYRALGRLLLALPEAELASLRERLLATLGSNAGLLAGVVPEFAALLGVAPAAPTDSDPLVAEARLYLAGVMAMRVIASPARPVVMVIDDLQWAGAGSIRFLHALMGDTSLSGLLLVAAYRPAEIDAEHPLAAALAQLEATPQAPSRLALQPLSPAAVSAMLGEMLRLPHAAASDLAQAVMARTAGNPFDTIEFVNALRHEGALALTEQGWRWSAAAIRRYVGHGEVSDLLGQRIARLPEAARGLLETLACLSGTVEWPLLQAALALSSEALQAQAAPALDEGLLALEPGDPHDSLRFRHNRVQQAASERLPPAARQQAHLTLARRLAPLPGWHGIAAEQYLAALPALSEEAECRTAAALFEGVATRVMRVNYVLADRFLDAAIGLLTRVQTTSQADAHTLLTLRTHRVGTLYCLGRHADMDAVYSEIAASCTDPLHLSEPAGLHLTSLTSRGRHAEAVALGLDLLHRLIPPTRDAHPGQAQIWCEIQAWAHSLDLQADLQRPDISEPLLLAGANLLHRVANAAYFCGPQLLATTLLYAVRLWRDHGPSAGLLSAFSQSPAVAVGLHQDYRTGYAISRHAVQVAQARGYQPHVSQTSGTLATFAQHWFEPLEATLRNLQQSREELLAGGSMTTASFAYSTALALLVDCAPSLDTLDSETKAAEELGLQVGNVLGMATIAAFKQLTRALRGQTASPGSFSDAQFDEASHLAGAGAHPVPGSAYRINRALAAAIFGDLARLAEHAAASMQLAASQANYRAAPAHLLQALALAQRLQAGEPDPAGALHAELATCRAWIAARASDAPGNYQHLLHWVDAERAWAEGEIWPAARGFDTALREVARHRRPWHHALLLERAGLLHLGHGLAPFGQQLMGEARQAYEHWGASAKVAELERRHSFLQASGAAPGRRERGRSTGVSAAQLDMVAILGASQALSSETSLARLIQRVNELLGQLTGATRVSLLLRGADDQHWTAPGSSADGSVSSSVEAAAKRGQLALSALRYVQRVPEPLLVEDAVLDDRFADDRYFTSMERCSLLAVPILSQGELRAVLMLENSQSRGAFSAERLDAVMLIAGQLAVSLDNALLYASLERKVAERTEALEQANRRLGMLAITDTLTGLANRRRFNEVLASEWKRAERTGAPLGLAMIDIDQFKLYNDHYGHLGGDACLQRVAACLQDGQRVAADLAARYGGEEFVLVLPNTDLAGTYTVAERLRAQVAALREPHALATHGVVTISIGITAFVPSGDLTPAKVLETADAALYEAKRNGRNQVWGQG